MTKKFHGTASAMGLIGLGKMALSHMVSNTSNIEGANTLMAEDLAETWAFGTN